LPNLIICWIGENSYCAHSKQGDLTSGFARDILQDIAKPGKPDVLPRQAIYANGPFTRVFPSKNLQSGPGKVLVCPSIWVVLMTSRVVRSPHSNIVAFADQGESRIVCGLPWWGSRR
jgi:hypothetical protein